MKLLWTGIILLGSSYLCGDTFYNLTLQIEDFENRLKHPRWEVRYYLLRELDRRDAETKQALEYLIQDENQRVVNQAMVRYVKNFVHIDKTLFDPKVYLGGKLPQLASNDELLQYCLGERVKPKKPNLWQDGIYPAIPILHERELNNPRVYDTLTIVGILGCPQDAKSIKPFLQSDNDYIVMGAALAAIRLGDIQNGAKALHRLTDKDPKKHLYYITEALHILYELEDPALETLVPKIRNSIDQSKGIQPNWVAEFYFLADKL